MGFLSWRDETTIHHRVMAHELEPFVDLIMFATRSLFRIRGIAAVPAFPLCDLPGAPSVAVLFCSVGVCRVLFVSSASRASGCIGDLAGADESPMFFYLGVTKRPSITE